MIFTDSSAGDKWKNGNWQPHDKSMHFGASDSGCSLPDQPYFTTS